MSEARPASGDRDESLREHLLYLLGGGGAHLGFDQAVADLAPELRGRRPAGLPYSAWELLEHLRICQRDILEFSRDPEWVSPEWTLGYWPQGERAAEPPDEGAWDRSVAAFRADLEAMKALVRDPERDLHQPFPWGDGQTLLREALLVADHNAYHLGQLVAVRRLLGAWSV
ncbi:MAG TPA: DinB family protein [Thermoanaerobaculia bacterium]|nr:DinB family protein [Thermoanaerobaculia bacterium]